MNWNDFYFGPSTWSGMEFEGDRREQDQSSYVTEHFSISHFDQSRSFEIDFFNFSSLLVFEVAENVVQRLRDGSILRSDLRKEIGKISLLDGSTKSLSWASLLPFMDQEKAMSLISDFTNSTPIYLPPLKSALQFWLGFSIPVAVQDVIRDLSAEIDRRIEAHEHLLALISRKEERRFVMISMTQRIFFDDVSSYWVEKLAKRQVEVDDFLREEPYAVLKKRDGRTRNISAVVVLLNNPRLFEAVVQELKKRSAFNVLATFRKDLTILNQHHPQKVLDRLSGYIDLIDRSCQPLPRAVSIVDGLKSSETLEAFEAALQPIESFKHLTFEEKVSLLEWVFTKESAFLAKIHPKLGFGYDEIIALSRHVPQALQLIAEDESLCRAHFKFPSVEIPWERRSTPSITYQGKELWHCYTGRRYFHLLAGPAPQVLEGFGRWREVSEAVGEWIQFGSLRQECTDDDLYTISKLSANNEAAYRRFTERHHPFFLSQEAFVAACSAHHAGRIDFDAKMSFGHSRYHYHQFLFFPLNFGWVEKLTADQRFVAHVEVEEILSLTSLDPRAQAYFSSLLATLNAPHRFSRYKELLGNPHATDSQVLESLRVIGQILGREILVIRGRDAFEELMARGLKSSAIYYLENQEIPPNKKVLQALQIFEKGWVDLEYVKNVCRSSSSLSTQRDLTATIKRLNLCEHIPCRIENRNQARCELYIRPSGTYVERYINPRMLTCPIEFDEEARIGTSVTRDRNLIGSLKVAVANGSKFETCRPFLEPYLVKAGKKPQVTPVAVRERSPSENEELQKAYGSYVKNLKEKLKRNADLERKLVGSLRAKAGLWSLDEETFALIRPGSVRVSSKDKKVRDFIEADLRDFFQVGKVEQGTLTPEILAEVFDTFYTFQMRYLKYRAHHIAAEVAKETEGAKKLPFFVVARDGVRSLLMPFIVDFDTKRSIRSFELDRGGQGVSSLDGIAQVGPSGEELPWLALEQEQHAALMRHIETLDQDPPFIVYGRKWLGGENHAGTGSGEGDLRLFREHMYRTVEQLEQLQNGRPPKEVAAGKRKRSSAISVNRPQEVEIEKPKSAIDSFYHEITLNAVKAIAARLDREQALFGDLQPLDWGRLERALEIPEGSPTVVERLLPLKGYQVAALRSQLARLDHLGESLLCLDMGLGKTVVMAAILAHKLLRSETGKMVVVTPLSANTQTMFELQNRLSMMQFAAAYHASEQNRAAVKNFIVNSLFSLFFSFDRYYGNDLEQLQRLFALVGRMPYFDYRLLFSREGLDRLKECPRVKTDLQQRLAQMTDPAHLSRLCASARDQARLIRSERLAARFEEMRADLSSFDEKFLSLFEEPCTPQEAHLLFGFYGMMTVEIPHEGAQNIDAETFAKLMAMKPNEVISQVTNKEELKNLKGGSQCAIVVTTYEQLKQEEFKTKLGSGIRLIIFDEAQTIHGTNKKAQAALEWIKALGDVPVLHSTATPIENGYSDLTTLLQIGNPDAIPSASVKALGRYLMLAKQAFEKGVEPEVISKAFTQFARFGHYASFAMTQGKKTDREILEDWNGRIPEKKRLVVSIPAGGRDLSESAKEGLKSANREAKKKTTDLREGLRKLENALIHPSLRDLTVSSAEGMAQIERLGREITSTESESALLEMMKEYPSICQLYKHHLFQEILQRQGRAVVFTSLDCSRDLTKKMLETLFRHQKKRVKLLTLHGSMSKEERQSALSSFRSAMGKDDARVLIISLQTGAVGLNIPEAEVSFFLTKGGYNPAYVEQAEDRIVRANCKSAGEVRHVVHFDWGTLLDEHVEVIRRKKQLWSELLKSCRELTAENMPMLFDLFVQILAYDRAHEILRASHSPKEMQALLWQKLPNKLLGELMRRPITHLMRKRLDENRGVISLRTLLSNLFVGKDNKALEEILALPQIAKLVDRRVDLNEESLAKADRVEVLLGGMGIDVAQFLAEAKPPFIKHCLQVIPSFIPARKDPEVPAPKKPRRAAGKEVTQAALEAVQGGAKRPFGQFERISMPVEGERGLKLAAWIGERASNDAALRAELVHTFKDRSLFEEVRGGRIDILGALQELFTRGLQEEEVRTDSNVRVWTFADGAYHNISGIASSSDQTIHLFGKSLAKGRNAYELLLER